MEIILQGWLGILIYIAGWFTIGWLLGKLIYLIWYYFDARPKKEQRLNEKLETLRDRVSRIERQLNIH